MADHWPTEAQLRAMERFSQAAAETAEETEDADGVDRMVERAALMRETLSE